MDLGKDIMASNTKSPKTSRERPKSAPYLRLNKICQIWRKIEKMGKNENVIFEL